MKNPTLFVYFVSPSFQSWSHSLKILLISLNIDKLIFKERMNNFESTTVKMKYAQLSIKQSMLQPSAFNYSL